MFLVKFLKAQLAHVVREQGQRRLAHTLTASSCEVLPHGSREAGMEEAVLGRVASPPAGAVRTQGSS